MLAGPGSVARPTPAGTPWPRISGTRSSHAARSRSSGRSRRTPPRRDSRPRTSLRTAPPPCPLRSHAGDGGARVRTSPPQPMMCPGGHQNSQKGWSASETSTVLNPRARSPSARNTWSSFSFSMSKASEPFEPLISHWNAFRRPSASRVASIVPIAPASIRRRLRSRRRPACREETCGRARTPWRCPRRGSARGRSRAHRGHPALRPGGRGVEAPRVSVGSSPQSWR